MGKKASCIWIAVVFLIPTVGGPILINWLYSLGPGWVTTWTAADMLSYYGTVLGAAITAFSLAFTISFTRKQIERGRYLEKSLERWGKVESIVMQALEDIDPLKMWNTERIGTTVTDTVYFQISNLQTYALKSKTSLDLIKSNITPQEYKKIEDLGNALQVAIEQFCAIELEMENNYCSLRDAAGLYNPITNNILVPFQKKLNELSQIIADMHGGQYQYLLNFKREVFDRVYDEVENEANQMLRFKKRNN